MDGNTTVEKTVKVTLTCSLKAKICRGYFNEVEALRYKPEGRGFDSQWSPRNFSMT